VKTCGDGEAAPSEAVDISAAWIMEDVEAVAKSFGVESRKLLRDTLESLRAEAALLDLG